MSPENPTIEIPGGAPSTEAFFCPACGQKHRGDLTAVKTGKAPSLTTPCARCKKPLSVAWKDGAVVVTIVEAAKPPQVAKVEAPPPAAVASAPPPPAPTPPPPKPPSPKVEKQGPLVTKKERAGREGKKGDESEKEAEGPAVVAEFPKGTKIDRYVLEDAIGEGGTGQVYRAFDATTNRYVAMKVLGKGLTDTMRERFLREIEVQANLRHPNIMPVFDRGEFEGRPYFTMELLYKPFTLTQIVDMAQDGTISRYTTLRPYTDPRNLLRDVLIPVCEAIYVANVENGVIHRDLKPDNVLVDSRTLRPYVIDFGICHVLERRDRFSTTVIAPTAEDAGIVGTPRFLAPEQARGAVHERTDVWGLGAILQYLWSGEAPIAASAGITRAELKRRIEALKAAQAAALDAGDEKKADLCAEKLARLEDQGLRTLDDLFQDARNGVYLPPASLMPGTLVAIAKKALSPKTAERYVNSRQMSGDLNNWLKGSRVLAHTEHGHTAGAAVQSAKRAVKRHLVNAVLVVAGAAIGFGITFAMKTGKGASAEGRLDDASSDLQSLKSDAERIGERASGMTPREASRVYDVLAWRLEQLQAKIAVSPGAASEVESLRQQAEYVGQRFGPATIRIRAPKGVKLQVDDVLRGGEPLKDVLAGDLRLKPGEYRVSAGEKFRAPIRVPYAYRDPFKSPDADRVAALATIDIPVDPATIPERMVLVAGATVPHRGPPFSEASAVPAELRTFLIDEFEVPNRSWNQFLDSITDESERTRRLPSVGFQARPDDAKRYQAMSGLEEMPVVGVSADDVLAYCAWRSKKEGGIVRLPNEAEWVLVAGGQFPDYVLPCGARGTPTEFALPVKAAKDVLDLSPFGVKGLLANVREMVTPYHEGSGIEVLVKGGACGDEPFEAAIRRLRRQVRDVRDAKTGFRCVREISAP